MQLQYKFIVDIKVANKLHNGKNLPTTQNIIDFINNNLQEYIIEQIEDKSDYPIEIANKDILVAAQLPIKG